MGKVATDVNTQIECLHERGMALDYPMKKIEEFLLDIGYYRLGFYWHPFEMNHEHNFIDGIKFSDIIKLYYLDVDLRHILLRYTSRIEINFRTKLIYHVSNKYKDSPTWFADPSVVNEAAIEFLNKVYSPQFIRNNKAIKRHHQKYLNDKYAPAWKTLEYLTFRHVFNIFKDLKDFELKEKIANDFGIISLKKFNNLFKIVIDVRNNCAHGDVLFDYKTPKGISVIPSLIFNGNDRNSMDACIKVVSFFLESISQNRQQELNDNISSIFNEYKDSEPIKGIVTGFINYEY